MPRPCRLHTWLSSPFHFHSARPCSVLQAGGLASEEKPQEVVGVVDSFLTALQLEGHGLGPQLRVGE